jgi:hypothetical protein
VISGSQTGVSLLDVRREFIQGLIHGSAPVRYLCLRLHKITPMIIAATTTTPIIRMETHVGAGVTEYSVTFVDVSRFIFAPPFSYVLHVLFAGCVAGFLGTLLGAYLHHIICKAVKLMSVGYDDDNVILFEAF